MKLARRFLTEPWSITDLATRENMRPSLVRRLLEEAGIWSRDETFLGHTEDQLTVELACRIRRGESGASIARRTGLDKRAVARLVARVGIRLREGQPIDASKTAYIIDRYAERASIRTIATETDSSYGRVRTVLRNAGIKLRPASGSLTS